MEIEITILNLKAPIVLVIQSLALSFGMAAALFFLGAEFLRCVETSFVSTREVLESILAGVRHRVPSTWRDETNDRKELRHFIYS